MDLTVHGVTESDTTERLSLSRARACIEVDTGQTGEPDTAHVCPLPILWGMQTNQKINKRNVSDGVCALERNGAAGLGVESPGAGTVMLTRAAGEASLSKEPQQDHTSGRRAFWVEGAPRAKCRWALEAGRGTWEVGVCYWARSWGDLAFSW